MRKRNNHFSVLVLFGLIFVFGLIEVVFAIAPTWQGSNINYTIEEDYFYYHNLSVNVTGFNGDITFAINTLQTNITWQNGSSTYNVSSSDVSSWIYIYNSSTGNLTINSSEDSQSGFFQVPIEAKNVTDDEATTTIFEFVINATNDYPNFTQIEPNYTLQMNNAYTYYINASDEENHWPLIFNITFFDNCTHGPFSGRVDGENCSILNFTFVDNETSKLNWTPEKDDVGSYWANITVTDAGENYNSSVYPYQEASYSQNKSYQYTSTVYFEIQANLEINASNCTNRIFQEGQWDWCLINITTQGPADNLNISSYAALRNYAAGQSGVQNTSWFYANESSASSSYFKTINASFTPSKTEIGNWTINFTVNDTTMDDSSTEQIYIYVNRTSNDDPELYIDHLPTDNITSVNLLTVINFSVYDDDTLIPDKNENYGGYNETITFNWTTYNQTTMAYEEITNFNITVLQMPVSGTNRTTAEIRFSPLGVDAGNYTINVSINDSEGVIDYETFNLSIINNSAPIWDNLLTTTFVIWEDNNTYLNLSLNCSDPDGDTLTFSFANDTQFDSFDVGASTGIVDFNASDVDVGQHIVNVTISDGYLTNTTTFNFTILNINDAPSFLYMDTTNATPVSNIASDDQVNCSEDNYTIFNLYIEDDDLKIPTGQKAFYNESLDFVLNIVGPNSSLFNFSVSDTWWPQPLSNPLFPNRTRFDAIFTPGHADLGDYNVTVNATDSSGNSTIFIFNMSVQSVEHSPVMSNLSNQSTAVNRTFYYDINVTDTEDGNDTSGETNVNFTFSYENLTGLDVFSGSFNTTTGLFNLTFNDSQDGIYVLNISVNDSGGLIDYDEFWIFVYSPPNVSFPSAGYVFNLTENSTSVLNFTANHSVGDNLTYEFYIDSVSYDGFNYTYGALSLRNITSSWGNGTSYNYTLTPTLSDETYGTLKNLTVVIYTNSSNLTNNSLVNTTINYKLNISHYNSPVTLFDDIDDVGPTAYTSDITINLSDHFYDSDYYDSNYNQTISFVLTSNTSSITSSISSDWILTLSASAEVVGLMSVLASDGESNATSRNFTIVFNTPTATSTTESSSGGSSNTKEVPVSLKILMPDPTSAYKKDYIELPIELYNDGEEILRQITLSGSVAKDGVLASDIEINFSRTQFDVLAPKQRQNLTMFINVNTERNGTFEITVNATVVSPKYSDWGKMYLTIKEGESVEEKILFTEEFIVENPECLELLELINEAKELMRQGKNSEAVDKSDEAIAACRELIAQKNVGEQKAVVEDPLYRYLIIVTIVVFFVGVGFYSYKRIMMQRKRGSFLQESIKSKKYM